MEKFNLYPLSYAIKKIVAVGMSGLVLTSSHVGAETYINPNVTWTSLSNHSSNNICMLDFDQDGDLDMVHYYDEAITLQKNIGTLSSPLFSPQKVIVSRPHAYLVKELNNPDQSCELQLKQGGHVDIDGDGDLDLFRGAHAWGKSGIRIPLEFSEKTEGGVEKIDSIFGLPSTAITLTFVDIDKDGDQDVFVNNMNEFYENMGTPQSAIFIKQESPLQCENQDFKGAAVVIDLNGDNQLDRVCGNGMVILSSPDGYQENENHLFQNSHFDRAYQQPLIDINQDGSPELSVIFHGSEIKQIRDIERDVPLYKAYSRYDKNEQNTLKQCGLNATDTTQKFFYAIGFSDFDGDQDDDFLAYNFLDPSTSNKIDIVYCENKGSADLPLYSSAIDVPSMDHITATSVLNRFTMGDLDGDGDQDLYANNFYDNTGTNEKPVFEHINHIVTIPTFSWLDLDNDRRVDSLLIHSQLINKGLEPATDIIIKPYKFDGHWGHYAITVNRPSQVQIFSCRIGGNCSKPTVLPNTAKEISLSVGDFAHTAKTTDNMEIALTMVDQNGSISLNIYSKNNFYGNFDLISRTQGGQAHSIATSAGQLDNDPEDEIVISFVQENGKVLSVVVNSDISDKTATTFIHDRGKSLPAGTHLDVSIIGLVQQGVGKNPSVAVGKFSDTSGSYAMSYSTPDNQLKISTIQGDGTIISQVDGGSASDAKVSKATFLPSASQDDYAISTLSPNGRVGLSGFSSKGDVLGQLTGGVAQQPTVISRYSETNESLGLAVSVIREDKKPAIVFLDNQGHILSTAVGGKTAIVATVTDGGQGNAILAYVDEDGIPRWETFSSDGVKQP